MNASPISLPSISELHENLPGLWLNNAINPDGLTFKQFSQCKKMYLAENKVLKEPVVLHALGYIAPLPFQLSSDNGYHPDKPLPPWCKSPLEAVLKIPAWCWLEKISNSCPINNNFDNVIANMTLLESLAATHASQFIKQTLNSFGSTIAESGNASIMFKHTMLVIKSSYFC